MSNQSRTPSDDALREKLRALALTTHTFDAETLAKLAKEAGLKCTIEQINTVADDLSSELSEDHLEHVVGGVAYYHQNYDYEANKKV